MADDFSSHEEVTATKVNLSLTAGRCLGRARRITTSGNTSGTALLAILELDDLAIKAGRHINIRTSPLMLDTDTANDVVRALFTYTTDGSTPTIASAQLFGTAAAKRLASAADPEHVLIDVTYVPAVDETLSLLLCINRSTGAGIERVISDGLNMIEFKVYDCGVDPGDTGVDL